MNDERRGMTHFAAQPYGMGSLFTSTALRPANVRQRHHARGVLLANKRPPSLRLASCEQTLVSGSANNVPLSVASMGYGKARE